MSFNLTTLYCWWQSTIKLDNHFVW